MLNAWHEEWADLSANWPLDQRPHGKQLTDAGWAAFEQAMPEALASKDDDWLVGEMSPAVCWMDKSPRKTKSGITTTRKRSRLLCAQLATRCPKQPCRPLFKMSL